MQSDGANKRRRYIDLKAGDRFEVDGAASVTIQKKYGQSAKVLIEADESVRISFVKKDAPPPS